MSTKIIASLKHHSKFFHYYLLIAASTPLLTFALLSFLPPKVNASQLGIVQQLDESVNLTVWGFLDRESLSVSAYPPTPIRTVWHNELIPLKNLIEIKPEGLFVPNVSYTLKITVKNRFGAKSTRTLTLKTNGVPKLAGSSLDQQSTNLAPKSTISFTFESLPNGGEVVFSSYPRFDFDQKVVGDRLVITPRKLKQNQEYRVTAYLKSQERFFGPLLEKSFTTIPALELVSSTPTNLAETVLKQSTLSFSFNKALVRSDFESQLAIDPKVEGLFVWKDDQNVEFQPKTLLQPATTYSITLPDSVKSLDGSELQEPLNLTFTTAGPVKVSQFHPSGGYPYLNTPIEVTFNQPVDTQSAQEHFSISPNIPGSFSWSGNKLIFKPKSLSVSKEYRVTLAPGVKSIGGEDSTETFSNAFTTTSEITKTIGYSVAGRAISATYFGIGPKKILLVGSMHGSESNTGNMLTSWIGYLRNNQSQIPSDRTFIIVPYANPDGKAASKRFNNNSVDLNRNWDTPDWQSLTYWQNRSYASGGGSAPFSEPETRALRDLVLVEKPSLTVTYHSAANVVLGDGISEGFGDWYANLTGYTRSKNTEEDDNSMSALGYIVTGTFEDWSSRLGNITLVVEFISATANEYSRNYPALKGLLTYKL